MVTHQTHRQIGVYGSNNRNQFELQKLFGEGPTRLAYRKETPQVPAHFTDPTAPSVCLFSFTTVKNRVKSVVDPTSEEKLREWELRVGREEAERIRTEAVAAGKLLHRRLECWMRGAPLGPCPLSKKFYCKALAEHILPHLRQELPPLGITVDRHFYPLSELTIVDFDRGYFGRFDLI